MELSFLRVAVVSALAIMAVTAVLAQIPKLLRMKKLTEPIQKLLTSLALALIVIELVVAIIGWQHPYKVKVLSYDLSEGRLEQDGDLYRVNGEIYVPLSKVLNKTWDLNESLNDTYDRITFRVYLFKLGDSLIYFDQTIDKVTGKVD